MQNMAKAERERKLAELKRFGATFKVSGQDYVVVARPRIADQHAIGRYNRFPVRNPPVALSGPLQRCRPRPNFRVLLRSSPLPSLLLLNLSLQPCPSPRSRWSSLRSLLSTESQSQSPRPFRSSKLPTSPSLRSRQMKVLARWLVRARMHPLLPHLRPPMPSLIQALPRSSSSRTQRQLISSP
jgi:hypothetical protein